MTCGDELRLVQTVDQMLELLVTSGEAQLKNIGSSHVVPHKMNRGGGMMEVRKVYAKGCNIMGVGFSMARCDPKRAVAFQSKPGDDSQHRRFVEFANQTPHLASFDSSQVEACSVGCGHLSQFLALVRSEVEVPHEFHNNPDLFGSSGGKNIDRHLLCRSQGPEFGTALDQGLKWTFIPYRIEQQFPKLPHFFQKALNTEHHIGEGETWDEQLSGIARSIVETIASNKKELPFYFSSKSYTPC